MVSRREPDETPDETRDETPPDAPRGTPGGTPSRTPSGSRSGANPGTSPGTNAGTNPPGDPQARLDALIEGVRVADGDLRRAHAVRYRAIERARVEAVSSADEAGRTRTEAEDMARRSVISEIACALRASEQSVQRLVNEAEQLVLSFPATLACLEQGSTDVPQVRDLLACVMTLPEERRRDFEAQALPQAMRLSPGRFRRFAQRLRERLHDEPLEERAERAREDRRVCLEPELDGMAWFSVHLSTEQGAMIMARIRALTLQAVADERRARRDRRAENEARRVFDARPAPPVMEDGRTMAQVEADVAVDLLLHGGLVPGDVPGDSGADFSRAAWNGTRTDGVASVRPTIFVTVPVLTLLGRSDEPADLNGTIPNGTVPIDAETARRLCGDATSFLRILIHPETGEQLSFGRDRYEVPASLRRYLRVRDLTCRFPGCGRAAARCDVDHTLAWEHGGGTDASNLAHLCRKHHTLKHHGSWRVRPGPSGALHWTSPAGRSYESPLTADPPVVPMRFTRRTVMDYLSLSEAGAAPPDSPAGNDSSAGNDDGVDEPAPF